MHVLCLWQPGDVLAVGITFGNQLKISAINYFSEFSKARGRKRSSVVYDTPDMCGGALGQLDTMHSSVTGNVSEESSQVSIIMLPSLWSPPPFLLLLLLLYFPAMQNIHASV